MEELLFTSASILDLLSSIEELADLDIHLEETSSGINITIGDSTYEINAKDAEEVEVPSEAVEEIADIADGAYEDLESQGASIDSEPIEGGPIKNILKTLLLGGMVKMTAKMLKEAK